MAIVKRLLKIAGALVALGIAAIAALLGVFWLQHNRELTLPAPTGPFAVSRTSYAWVDDTRIDPLAPHPGMKRELTCWIWFPAVRTPSSRAVEYLPAPWRKAIASYAGVLLSSFLTRDPSVVRAHSIRDGAVAPAQPTYPIVIMKPGLGALSADYTTLAEDLASHGYVVVGSDETYSTSVVVFPDGRVVRRTPVGHPPENFPEEQVEGLVNKLVTVWSADTGFVLNQLERLNAGDPSGKFTGRLDVRKVGVFGHSFGGATAAQFCHDDARCKAGIDMDGAPFGSVVQESLQQPFMFLLSDHTNESDPAAGKILAHIQSIYDRLPNGRMLLTIRGTAHFNFSDQALLKERHLFRLFGALGPIDEHRALAVTTGYVHTFFDVYLKDAPVTKLKDLSRVYPEAVQ